MSTSPAPDRDMPPMPGLVPRAVADIVRAAFDAIRGDVPEADEKFRRCAPRMIALALGGEEMTVINAAGGAGVAVAVAGWVAEAPELGAGAEVRIELGLATLLDLVDGPRTLIDALDDGSLRVIGATEALAATDEAVTAFLQGAVRSPRAPALLAELRARAAAPAENQTTDGRRGR